jgi:hypothetical protein
MPRKARDYKAEYARRKQRANELGFSSPREYSQARKRFKQELEREAAKSSAPVSREQIENYIEARSDDERYWKRRARQDIAGRRSPYQSGKRSGKKQGKGLLSDEVRDALLDLWGNDYYPNVKKLYPKRAK